MSDTTIDTPAIDANAPDLSALLQQLHGARVEIARVVVGQASVVDHLLIALLCNGHVLLEGVPGVGKTLLVRTLGAVTGLHFSRIQFTPDLMPADITGGQAIVPDETTGQTRIEFRPGPIFTQILLADEINRATPKTQSALLEAMQERTATVGGRTMELPKPLLVLATQNPIEMEGTYQLPRRRTNSTQSSISPREAKKRIRAQSLQQRMSCNCRLSPALFRSPQPSGVSSLTLSLRRSPKLPRPERQSPNTCGSASVRAEGNR